MHRVTCTALGAALGLLLLVKTPANAYTCHATSTDAGYSYEIGYCTFHCLDGDHTVGPECAYFSEWMIKDCSETTQYCPIPCHLIYWQDFWHKECLCNYWVGCDPDSWWYYEEESCDVCGSS